MSASVSEDDNTRKQINDILQAAAGGDLIRLEEYINKYSFNACRAVDVQDPETGFSPLHAVINSCEVVQDDTSTSAKPNDEDRAIKTVHCLLENGAIWNTLDKKDETAGCIAFRKGLMEVYGVLVDAGVRAELLLSRLEEKGYIELEDDENDVREMNDDEEEAAKDDEPKGISIDSAPPNEDEELFHKADNLTKEELQTSTSSSETTRATQPIIQPVSSTSEPPNQSNPTFPKNDQVLSSAYLSSTLSLSDSKLIDSSSNAVMMSWETEIMRLSVSHLLTGSDLRILNIGFGMGIIDTLFQSHPDHKPGEHHIIEAHPDVLSQLTTSGWHDKPNVTIHQGKWQDILPELSNSGETFDVVYFDTFAESYASFREFFSEHLISLLSERGKWSFFNGMGADRQISYDVYQKVVELDLFEAGFDVNWVEEVDVPLAEMDRVKEWEGVRRRYWSVDKYRLPICGFMD